MDQNKTANPNQGATGQKQCAGCGKAIANPQNAVHRGEKDYCCQTCADKNADKA